MPPPEKKRKILTLATKVDIIHAVDSFNKKGDVAKKFDIPSSTLSTILGQKDKIIEEWSRSASLSQRKKICGVTYADIDGALLQSFSQQRARNVPINGPLLQEKARQFAQDLSHEDFKASTGFLDSFKARNGITFRAICGESSAANTVGAAKWKTNILPQLLQQYKEEDVYNADESAFFYECLPNPTMAFK